MSVVSNSLFQDFYLSVPSSSTHRYRQYGNMVLEIYGLFIILALVTPFLMQPALSYPGSHKRLTARRRYISYCDLGGPACYDKTGGFGHCIASLTARYVSRPRRGCLGENVGERDFIYVDADIIIYSGSI